MITYSVIWPRGQMSIKYGGRRETNFGGDAWARNWRRNFSTMRKARGFRRYLKRCWKITRIQIRERQI